MFAVCKNKCWNESSVRCNARAYGSGAKWCVQCEKRLRTTDVRCYCCRGKLRTVPAHKRKTPIEERVFRVIA